MLQPSPLLPAVLLVRTQEAGNIGAAARAMANMGLSELHLAAPRADPADHAALAFAVGARDLLAAARRHDSLPQALASFAHVVGTTSERDRAASPPPISAADLPRHLATLPNGTPTVLVFGPESSGLTRDELSLCQVVVQIPCAPEHPTLNLAQAVLLVAYEMHQARMRGNSSLESAEDEDDLPAATEQLDGLAAQLDPLLRRIGFARDSSYRAVKRDLRQLLARASPNRREVRILRGIARRGMHALGRSAPVIDSQPHSPQGPAGNPDESEESG